MATLGMNYTLDPPPVPPAAGLTQLLTSPKGGWSEPQRSKALQYGGYTYIGWVAGGSGDVGVSVVQNSTLSNLTNTVLHAALGGEGTADMHDNPGMIVRDSDHKLIAYYCRHADTVIRYRISTTSLDTDPDLSDGFAAEVLIDPGTTINDYPIAFQLLGETNDPIYVVYRSTSPANTARWLYITSTNGGVTWSANRWLYRNSGRVTYGQVNSNGIDRFDFIFQDANEGEVTNNFLRHGYYEGGQFFTSTGTLIGTAPLASPLTDGMLTLAATGAGFHLFGIERDTVSGDIALTASARISGLHYVYRVAWDESGQAWSKDLITTSPGPGGIASGPYSWGNVIDPEDFDHAIVSRWIDGRAELYECTFSGTWTVTALTEGSVADWVWPNFVKDYATEIKAVVLFGSYTTYTNYAFATYGFS